MKENSEKTVFRTALKRNFLIEIEKVIVGKNRVSIFNKITKQSYKGLNSLINELDIFEQIDIIIIAVGQVYAKFIIGEYDSDMSAEKLVQLKTEIKDNTCLIGHLLNKDYLVSRMEIDAMSFFNNIEVKA